MAGVSDGSSDLRYRPCGDVLARELDGEAVLLDLATGRYFGLNETGRRIFELLDGERTVAEVEAALLAEFDAPPAELGRDLRELLDALERAGLVMRPERAPAP